MRTMPGWILVPWLLTAVLAVLPGEVSAGWVIDQVVKGSGDRQQMLLQSNRVKMVKLGADGHPTAAMIMDLDVETITQVDYEQRTYLATSIPELVDALRRARQAAGPQMAQAMKQMEAAMKDMPPDQRRMVEQMMRQQMGGQAGSTEDCREPELELRPTGQTATIAGFAATRHELLADGKPDGEVWLARGLAAWRELDPARLQRMAGQLSQLAACSPGAVRAGDAAVWRAMRDSYPVRVVDSSGTTTEVVRAESRSIPPGEFQPPAGFTRKSLEGVGRR